MDMDSIQQDDCWLTTHPLGDEAVCWMWKCSAVMPDLTVWVMCIPERDAVPSNQPWRCHQEQYGVSWLGGWCLSVLWRLLWRCVWWHVVWRHVVWSLPPICHHIGLLVWLYIYILLWSYVLVGDNQNVLIPFLFLRTNFCSTLNWICEMCFLVNNNSIIVMYNDNNSVLSLRYYRTSIGHIDNMLILVTLVIFMRINIIFLNINVAFTVWNMWQFMATVTWLLNFQQCYLVNSALINIVQFVFPCCRGSGRQYVRLTSQPLEAILPWHLLWWWDHWAHCFMFMPIFVRWAMSGEPYQLSC